MLAFTMHTRFPHRNLRSPGGPGRRILARAAAAACVITGIWAAAPGPASASPAFSHLIVVTDLADAGPGSLRAAITAADATPPGTSTLIDFNVAGTITLASRLPAIRRPINVNGTSAPGYRTGGPPLVEIDCNSHGGLHFARGLGRVTAPGPGRRQLQRQRGNAEGRLDNAQ